MLRTISPRSHASLRLAALALLLISAACGPQPAPASTATEPAGLPTAAPSPSAVSYPTLPPEWTATFTPTPTLTPVPPTATRTPTVVPTLAFTVTPSVGGVVFTGTAAVNNQPLALPAGVYRLDWEYIGPAGTAFTLRLASPDSNSTVTFVDGVGPQRGASDLRIIGNADLLLSVEAAGPWVLFIQPAAGVPLTVTVTPTVTPTPTLSVLPAPT